VLDLFADNRVAIESLLRANGWIEDGERIEQLAKAGDGNMNRTLRADLGERTLILKQSVPFVAKYPDIAAPADRISVEAEFYRASATAAAVAARLPKVIGFDADNRLLALEDLGVGADFTDAYRNRKAAIELRDAAPDLLQWLSALHGIENPPRIANHAMRTLNHEHIFDIPFRTDNGLDLDALTPGLAELARAVARDREVVGRVRALGEIYLGDAAHESRAVLLHGDFYPGSFLRAADGTVRIIDPEFGFVGVPEFDIGVFIAHLAFARLDEVDVDGHYQPPNGYSIVLARQYAAVEVLRRLLGVAQLPLEADLPSKRAWIDAACRALKAPR